MSWKFIGKLSAWRGRAGMWMGLVSFYTIIFVLQDNPLMATIEIVALLIALIIDIKYIMPNELDYAIEKTPYLVQLLADTKEIKEMLKGMKS
jgi:tryptophan-rich sensory protein